MNGKKKSECVEPECACGCQEGGECTCEEHEIEVVELEDENGEKADFAILDELKFEGRHFAVMAPLAEVQALHDNEEAADEIVLNIEIFEVDGENFTILEDEELGHRLMQHLDELSVGVDED
jgi:hypothetical protein